MTQPAIAPPPTPAPSGGDRIDLDSCANHLLLIFIQSDHKDYFQAKPQEGVEGQPNFKRAEKAKDAVMCDVVDLDAPGGPKTWIGVMLGAVKLHSQLKQIVGQYTIGTLGKEASAGTSFKAWVLMDAGPMAVTRAQQWLAQNPAWRSQPGTAAVAHHGAPEAAPAWAGAPSTVVQAAPAAQNPAEAFAAWQAQQAAAAAPPMPPAYSMQAQALAAQMNLNLADPQVQAFLASQNIPLH